MEIKTSLLTNINCYIKEQSSKSQKYSLTKTTMQYSNLWFSSPLLSTLEAYLYKLELDLCPWIKEEIGGKCVLLQYIQIFKLQSARSGHKCTTNASGGRWGTRPLILSMCWDLHLLMGSLTWLVGATHTLHHGY